MKSARPSAYAPLLIALGAILAGLTGCRVLPQAHLPGRHSITLASARPAALVTITDPESVPAMRATGALVASTVRPGERVIILSARGGALLASSQAPLSPTASVPDPPAMPSHPTSFQRARYEQAAGKYRSTVSRARGALLREQRLQLQAWAASLVAQAARHPVLQNTRDMDIGADLGAAASAIASMRQAGLPYGTPVVIAVMVVDQAAASEPPTSPTSLQASTVVVNDFPDNAEEQTAWQSSLVQDGASRGVMLTPATGDQLATLVRQGLDGAITDTLTSVLFGMGKYTLQPAALPQLRHLLRLLAVRYPHATASVDGYTDNLPVPGGNLLLSRRRAQQVERWLTQNGIAAGRLQAFGYGDTDPIAPNTPAGQPLNRRVVVVIDPAVAA
jgi:outer membrane protein OmpA-like peptidoglycan-associated protein